MIMTPYDLVFRDGMGMGDWIRQRENSLRAGRSRAAQNIGFVSRFSLELDD
jgi:hypothetical protein